MAEQDTQQNGQSANGVLAVRTPAPLSPAMTVQQAVNAHKMILDIVQNVMIEGHDYGTVPGTRGKMLFKAGAERLCSIFGLAVTVPHINRDHDSAAGFLEYTVTIELVSKQTGLAAGQGIGSCNSHEKKYRSQDAANIANTILKMAKKRALSDAVLAATGASGMFELDEDEMESQRNANQNGRGSGNAGGRQSPPRSNNQSGAPPRQPPPPMTDATFSSLEELAREAYGTDWKRTLEEFYKMPISQWSESRGQSVIRKIREDEAQATTEAPPSAAPADEAVPAGASASDALYDDNVFDE